MTVELRSESRTSFSSAISKLLIPGPPKNRLGAVPTCPSAGRLKSEVLKAGLPLREFVFISRLPEAKFGVSTPLLLMPFGMVPSREVSLLL